MPPKPLRKAFPPPSRPKPSNRVRSDSKASPGQSLRPAFPVKTVDKQITKAKPTELAVGATCIACNGSGRSSSGRQCYPCRGLGKKLDNGMRINR